MRASWRTASREELIAELERRERENERLRREREEADRERDRYRRERDRLRKTIDRLEDELDDARRALHRQAAPFSRGAHTHEVLASILRTIQQRQLNASVVFSDLLRAPKPITAL